MGTGSFPGVKSGRGVTLTLHRLLVPWSRKSRYNSSPCTVQLYLYSPLWAVRSVQSLSACTVQLYLYSPYGPYSLYRASVPVQYSYTSTPPMDRTACTEPQCLYSIAIPLLPLWAVQPLLPSVPVQYSYNSTPLWTVRPLQRLSACTVELYLYSPYRPHCLYRASVPVQ